MRQRSVILIVLMTLSVQNSYAENLKSKAIASPVQNEQTETDVKKACLQAIVDLKAANKLVIELTNKVKELEEIVKLTGKQNEILEKTNALKDKAIEAAEKAEAIFNKMLENHEKIMKLALAQYESEKKKNVILTGVIVFLSVLAAIAGSK